MSILICYFVTTCFVPWRRLWRFLLQKLESPSPHNVLCRVWLKLTKWFLRKFFKFANIFLHFRYYIPLKKAIAVYLNKLEYWSNIGPVVLQEKIFKFYHCISAFSLIWANLNPHHSRIFCANFVWIWSSGSRENDFQISPKYFHYYLPLEMVTTLYLNKLGSHFPEECFVPSLVKIVCRLL